jgi:hypothetical protein
LHFFFFLSYGIFVTLGAEGNITALMVDWKKFGKIILFGMGNSKLCASGSRKKKSIVVPIVASLGGLLILSLIVAATLLRLRRKRQDKTKGKIQLYDSY